jgi:hypothetical protein
MAEIRVLPRIYEVTAWPEELAEESDADVFCVMVWHAGKGQYCLSRGMGYPPWHGLLLLTTGEWGAGKPARMTLDEALAEAEFWAPHIMVNGWTAAQCIAWHQAGCPRDGKHSPVLPPERKK